MRQTFEMRLFLARTASIHTVAIIQSACANACNYSSRVELFAITFVGCRSGHVCAEREMFANNA